MKKALYIGGFIMPDGNAAAQRVLGVAKVLRECGYGVRFSGLTRASKEPQTGNIDGFDYVNYPYPQSPVQWLKYLTGRDSAISEIEDYGPELVILYNHPAFAIEHIAKFCHRKYIKVLADITEWYEPQGNPIFTAIKGYDTNRRMRLSHQKLDGLICISSYLSEYYRNNGVKVTEIPPLVDTAQAKWHQDIEVGKDEVRLVYAGSPGVTKDRLDLILKALDEIIPTLNNKVRFDIIGISKEQYVATWGDNKNRDYVIFNGRRPHEEVIRKLLEADFQIFLRPDSLPNRAGFPTKFVETISSGTLPITNLSSNLKDYISDGKNGFIIKALDGDSIKETLGRALGLPSREIASLKQSLNRNLFDYSQYIGQTELFINSL